MILKSLFEGKEIAIPSDQIKFVCGGDLSTELHLLGGEVLVVNESYGSITGKLYGTISLMDMEQGQFGVVVEGVGSWIGEKILRANTGIVFLDTGYVVPKTEHFHEARVMIQETMELP